MEVDGITLSPTMQDRSLLYVAAKSLIYNQNFKIVNSLGVLRLMASIPLLSLRRIELVNYGIIGSDLIRLLQVHHVVLKNLKICDNIYERAVY